MRRRRPPGFTLVELMITVVIIGVIAAIAYPSYQNYTKQTRRSDAQIALTQAANQQERFFTECNHYAQVLHGSSRACGTSGASYSDGVLKLFDAIATPILSPEKHYVITLVTPDATNCPITSCYILQATPATTAQGGTSLQINNGNLRIRSTGVKSWDKDNSGNYQSKWTDK